MRIRTNSNLKLDYYHRLVLNTVLIHQDSVTGLIPSVPKQNHAWIRDNVYSIISVWGLAMTYRKTADLDEDRAKTYELEQACVKCMRGLLFALMGQKHKVEKFKTTLKPEDSLHAKYSSCTAQPVVSDSEWGHLQIDAISLYLLILAQMTASDEVAFIQNLVFYIESAYCIPDYGIWERGDKTNHGLPELNASSIGMAKAALEAINELDLFGCRGGPASVVHVLADEGQNCHAVLQSMLPRESSSKEVDASLLSVIGFPAFAVDDMNLIQITRKAIIEKLLGKYGCKRFLRDGYKTAREDSKRLYYEPWELRAFENVENEWPLFFCYLLLDYIFHDELDAAKEISLMLEKILLNAEDGLKLVPEMYMVPEDLIQYECENPHSQVRVPIGKIPFIWAQSLYILSSLLLEGCLAPGELDPLNRRLSSEKKPDVVVQVVILAESVLIQEKLENLSIHVQTIDDVLPIEVQPAKVLSQLYTYLGYNKKLGLTGRKSTSVGTLSTSKLYTLQDRIFAFTPQFMDQNRFYIACDTNLLIDIFTNELNFLQSSWKQQLGRPLVIQVIKSTMLDNNEIPAAIISLLKKLKSGYTNGTRVTLGNISEFLNTSSITDLSFLGNLEDGNPDDINPNVMRYLEDHLKKSLNFHSHLKSCHQMNKKYVVKRDRRLSVKGSIRRSRSIAIPYLELDSESPDPMATVINGNISKKHPYRTSVEDVENEELEEIQSITRSRTYSDAQYEKTEMEDLFATLRETENLEEQGDILHFLATNHGLQLDTGMGTPENPTTIHDLLKELYSKACHQRHWALVRHLSGMLGKRVEDLSKSITDLLVRQKQVTVGMPPYHEQTIIGPMPSVELRHLIHESFGADQSSAMLTQELIFYLAMFIRTEPQLFAEVLRVRIGLLIKVMILELARSLHCSGEEASEYLLNLSPFVMKDLLHHILSGKEFIGNKSGARVIVTCSQKNIGNLIHPEKKEEKQYYGQWLRRRKLDGALNRVPAQFYFMVWKLLEKCQGLAIEGKVLLHSLTQEMTSGEMKFALHVETLLNTIPQPEYRQLIVETLMVLCLLPEYKIIDKLNEVINVEQIIHAANKIFLEDQKNIKGDSTLCCVKDPPNPCGGAAYICRYFYDSAPSGSYGTMSYLLRAAACILSFLPADGEIDCKIS